MALGNLPPTTEAWGRWPQRQDDGADFNMMAGMVPLPYDSRTTTAAPIPRPEFSQHFLPGHFSPAPMPAPVSPHYQTPMSYGGYNHYTPPPMLDVPFKADPFERHPPAVPVEPPLDGGMQARLDGLPHINRSCSPSIKSEARSTVSGSPSPMTPSERVQEIPLHQFNTAIDKLVRVIEAKREILSPEDMAESLEADEKKEGKDIQIKRGRGKAKRKRFSCDFHGCSKMFAQKNNLDTHRRSHTGESPYVCPYCCRRFTQSVNLKSHINRHTGARPYKCPHCPKVFPQPSNVKAHMKTHIRRELRAHWVCRFGNCQKAFTAKGNLKNHQNTYHVEAIEAFNAKLASMEDKSMLSDEEKEMAKYLADVHNLANKGIKGRGKGRKVKRVPMLQPQQQHHHHQQQQLPSPDASPISTTSTHPMTPYHSMSLMPHHGLPVMHHHHTPPPQHHQHHHQHQHQHQHHSLPFYGGGLSNPAAYSMGRPPPSMLFGGGGGGGGLGIHHTHHHGGYGMLDSDQLSDASSVHGSTPVSDAATMQHVYGDEQGRGGLAFGERLY